MSGVNPLKHARSTPSADSKADLKARELWHRKSGAGYRLFVDYYQGQPKGVVYDDYDARIMSLIQDDKHSTRNQGIGQSRAAKRRRKKQKTFHPEEQNEKDVECSTVNESKFKISDQFEQAIHGKDCKNIRPFLSAMSKALPLTLRLRHNSCKNDLEMNKKSDKLINELKSYSHFVRPVSYDASTNTIYQAVPGSNLAKFNLGKLSPQLKSLILNATATGVMARQELGSMLPVIALQGVGKLKYGSKVLDMCASPGSKTLQALEIVASPPEGSTTVKRKGRVVANDIHPLRLESLKDAIKRSGVSRDLTDRIIFTNHNASKFPTPKSGTKFDCIIADVPCSGSGTIRKDPHILPGWVPSISNSLHELQMNILKRAIKLLKVDGVVVYSTCSINPIEDEAVVTAVLSWANKKESGSLRLLQWPKDVLPGLKIRPGVLSWRVANFVDQKMDGKSDCSSEDIPRLTWYECFENAKDDQMAHVLPSLWPLPIEQMNTMNLNYCARLLPQDNDTGGFFVAILQKIKEI